MTKHLERSPKRKAFAYMKGWSHATGVRAIPGDCREDEDYNRGFHEGKHIRKLQRILVEEKYGITFELIFAKKSEFVAWSHEDALCPVVEEEPEDV